MISHLDYLMSLPQVHREIYGYCEDEKPNDHCVWTDIGYSQSVSYTHLTLPTTPYV